MDRELGIWLSPHYYIPMSTVISSVPTAEGFVIGSDGRKTGPNPQEKLSDDTQKIFSLDRRGMKLAYGLFGTITLGESRDNILWNIESEFVRAVEQIGSRSRWSNYLEALTTALYNSLNAARTATKLTLPNETGTTICIGGYFGKSQQHGHIRFEHGIHQSQAESHNDPPGFSFPWGNQSVLDLLNGGDTRFAKYSQPKRIGLLNLSDGIERVRNDILAHYDAEAFKLDETIRWNIGGRVQIATITLSDGFQWVKGHEPIQAVSVP